jgi:[acyl-carrier-protein] S-malonyltransferase
LALFPGQGSQVVGMGRRAVETSPAAAEFFDAASQALGRDLRQLCWNSPRAALTETANAQVALTAASIADWLALREQAATAAGEAADSGGAGEAGSSHDACSGHSVGALAAAVAAGFLSPVDGVRLAAARGQLMAQAPAGGSMLALAAPVAAASEAELLAQAHSLAQEHGVEVAALNGPKQFVLAGGKERLAAVAQRYGAASKMLQVSNAFHSRYMAPVAPRWRETVHQVDFKPGRCRYVGCTTAQLTTAVDDVRTDLIRGLTEPVRWFGVLERTADLAQINVFGPGQAIARLTRSHLGGRPLRIYGGGR